MTSRKLLLAAILILPLSACTNKGPLPPTASAPATAPIDPSTVGELTGTIHFVGTKPAPQRIMMDQDPACLVQHGGQTVFAEDGAVNSDGTLANAFVYVKAGAEKYPFAPPADPVVLDQAGCMYKPHVLGLMAGQILRIVSSDDTTHNVHPMPKNNREWNMAQAPGAAPIEQKFPHPEIMIPLKCNAHPWMRAWIGVTSNPFFAVSGSDGTFTIKGLPPGDYTLAVWTATFGIQEKEVTLAPKQLKTVDFQFRAP